MNNVVVIYLDEKPVYAAPLTTQRRIDAYSDLAFAIEKLGVKVFVARSPDSYTGNGKFSSSYKFTAERDLVPEGEVQASIIFDKGDRSTLPGDGFAKINHVDIDKLCDDKIGTAQIYSEISPVTIPVSHPNEVQLALDKVPGSVKVFKPSVGFGGEGIEIGTDKQIISHSEDINLYPALIQEFVDSSSGVTGIVDGVHDLRVIVINGEIMQFSVRKPPAGSYKANVQLGGSIEAIEKSKVPLELRDIVDKVDEHLKQYGNRVYSVDATFDGNSYKLIELNSRPGWHPISQGPEAVEFVNRLAGMLVDNDQVD